MSEFPGTEWTTSPISEESSRRKPISTVAGFGTDAALWTQLAPPAVPLRKLDMDVTHVFTHFRLELEIYVVEIPHGASPPAGCRWVRETDLDREALPSVMRKVLKAVRENDAVR